MSFAAPAFLWLLAAIPLVVLLHFLRMESTRREVAALFLWREARELADMRRRLSPTWLLLIQILFVAAAALALAQPRFSLAGPPDAVLVIDASASMTALEPGGRTRLELAKSAATDVAGRRSRVALVRAGLDAVVVHPLDGDRGAFGSALSALRAGDRVVDLERAVDLAADIAAGGEVHVFTDAPLPPRVGVVRHPVGTNVPNTGIVAFDVGLQEAFIAVASNAERPFEVGLELLRQGQPVASTSLFVPVNGQGTVTFPLTEAGIYEVRLAPPPAGDALALDDVAFAGRRDLAVVLDRPSDPVQRALAALPGVSVRVTSLGRSLDAGAWVLTGTDPEGLGPGSYLLLAEPAAEPEYRVVRDVDAAHPLMRFVDLRETVVGVDPAALPPPDEEGWTVLARDAELAPLVRARVTEDQQIVQLLFHPSQTDAVLRPAFPALIANAVRSFRGEDRIDLGATPRGAADRVLEPGIVDVAGRVRTASLLSAAETRLGAAPPARTASDEDSRGAASERATGIAPWLLAAALAALAAEWWLARRTSWWAWRRG